MSARSRSKPWFSMSLEQRVLLEASSTAQQLVFLQFECSLDRAVTRYVYQWTTARAMVAELLLEARAQ